MLIDYVVMSKKANMKFLLTISFLLSLCHAQSVMDPFIIDGPPLKAGSCGSPDGPTTLIGSPPPNYQYLEDNGYCIYNYPTTATFTACFTVTSPGTAIDFNAGSSVSCINRSFSSFTLYDASCTQIGTGLSFTGLTPGADYIWCLSMRAWGGPTCSGFDTFCPYFIDMTPLPISLGYFRGDCDGLEWMTYSETNNDFFTIQHSVDHESWVTLATISGASNSNQEIVYNLPISEQGYYKLSQTDHDGTRVVFPAIHVPCKKDKRRITKYLNVIGQEVKYKDINGYYIVVYNDGTTSYSFKTEQ